jgi:dUTP pyrophosphatase
MKVKFKKLHQNAIIPKQATTGAGAMDVTCTEIIQEDGYVCCKVGFATEIPVGYRVICAARSSITKTGWILANGIGIVDSDYRGEWEFRFVPVPTKVAYGTALGNKPFPYVIGDRIGQIFLEKVTDMEFVETEYLSNTERSTKGFGSTGNLALDQLVDNGQHQFLK